MIWRPLRWMTSTLVGMPNRLRQRRQLQYLRRSQSSIREDRRVLERAGNRWKLHPIVDWTDRDIGAYLKAHALPWHPLWEKGYVSIGDVHTTRPLSADVNVEATRFFGLKRECGLHELSAG